MTGDEAAVPRARAGHGEWARPARHGPPVTVIRVALDPATLRALAPEISLREGSTVVARVAAAQPNGRGTLALAGALLPASLPAGPATGDVLRLLVQEVGSERIVLRLLAQAPAGTAHGGPTGTPQAGPATTSLGRPASPPDATGAAPTGPQRTAAGGPAASGPTRPEVAGAAAQAGGADAPASAGPATGSPVAALALPGGGSALIAVDRREGSAADSEPDEQRGVVALRWQSPTLGRLDVHLRLDPAGLRARIDAPPGISLRRVRAAADELAAALGHAAQRPAQVTVRPRSAPLGAYA